MREMREKKQHPLPIRLWRYTSNQLSGSIGTKIILPYLLLTLAVGGVGAFIVVRLVADSLQERFNNQLLDAGRVVSESIVEDEEQRLAVLRVVAGTEGVPVSLLTNDRAELASLVPQIIANSNTDVVELLDMTGREIYGWQRPPNQGGSNGEERTGADFSTMPEVRRILEGYVDEHGEKRVTLLETPHGPMIFTVGPVFYNGEQVGAAMVGTYIRELVVMLTENAVARVTLYDPLGQVIDTAFGSSQPALTELLQESPDRYETVLTLLNESSERYPVVTTSAEDSVPLRRVQVLGQEYSLAYGDWRLRGQSLGLFSVALPNNFIVSAAVTSRNSLSILFSIATICVFALGFVIARRIVNPLHRLAQTSVAISEGDLSQRTGIARHDEIGTLAHSFDVMTDRLVERNRQLVEEASKLKAILDSNVDGFIVLDRQGLIIASNPAARAILNEVSSDFLSDILRRLPSYDTDDIDDSQSTHDSDYEPELDRALQLARLMQPHRYHVGERVLSALTAPVKTPGGEELGTVVALRDITREAEAEQLKDSFITSISHELRTPLTAIKGYSDLLLKTANGNLDETQLTFAQTINRNVDQLMHHIGEIIDISEIQAGTLRLAEEEVCFTRLVEKVAESWRERLEAKGLSLDVRLGKQEGWVTGDPKRLAWAVENLLSNAHNYTLAGGKVKVRVSQVNGEVCLDVTDTGIGIAVADQPYLFTRFFRATHEETYDVGGVGLGLFITRSIIELHGGRVWARSKLGLGSTFSLALPVLEQREGDEDVGARNARQLARPQEQ